MYKYVFQHVFHFLDFISHLTKHKKDYTSSRDNLTVTTNEQAPANLYGGTELKD